MRAILANVPKKAVLANGELVKKKAFIAYSEALRSVHYKVVRKPCHSLIVFAKFTSLLFVLGKADWRSDEHLLYDLSAKNSI